mgnify:CR=1 FL=1
MFKHFVISCQVLLICTVGFAQTISSPSKFLGYEIGDRFTRHHRVVDYFELLAKEAPDRLKLEYYGTTNEGRPLVLAYVTSSQNMNNLEAIRTSNLGQAGIGNSLNSNEKAIVWLSYNVHGNEASSSEASMSTVYALLTKDKAYLENTVVIIDPCINPDGRDRYVNWFNETASVPYDISQQASEHQEPWPGGRPNHYLFDLNRDWAWATQIESSSRLKVYNKWLPHIHVDFHEQGINDPYYFAPAAEPFHEVITDWQRDFQTEIGKNHAKYFDQNGWLYFTGEIFDLFYPSYGDTYPTFMGAIGMTYEQAGHGRAGLGILNDEGLILTLKDRALHHTTTGLSTVEVASQNATALNREFKKFFATKNYKYNSYVLKGKADQISALTQLLDKHEITYGYAENGKVSGYHYSTAKSGGFTTTSNDLVVNLNQPKSNMVKVLFEPKSKLSDSLTYDISAWSLPYAYGLDAIASTTKVNSSAKMLVTSNSQIDKNAVAYTMEWQSLEDAKFLSQLIQNKIKVRFSSKAFTTSAPEKNFKAGALIIYRGDNSSHKSFDKTVVNIANANQRQLTAVKSGFSKNGPDFGSGSVSLINTPKIAVLSGKGTYSLNYGEIWHFFEQQLHYPLTSINAENFGYIKLSDFNVLILPSGNYRSHFDDSGFKKLKEWISNGGKVIAIENAMNSFANKSEFDLKRISSNGKEPNKLAPYDSRERDYITNVIIGAIFETHLDTTHPLAFGYNKNYFSLKVNDSGYQLLNSGFNVGHIGDQPKVMAGFAGHNALKNLNNSMILGEEQFGNGRLIYFVDNPLFRSFWENGKLLMANAIFLTHTNSLD